MIAKLTSYWEERSGREKILLAVMGVLFAIVFIWLGIARPAEAGLESARAGQADALDRNVAIRAKVKTLESLPRTQVAAPVGPLDQFVGQSAGEAGFTLERSQAQGPGRVEIAMASARPTALFGWISRLEGQGVIVESLTVQPGATAGTVSVRGVLKAAGQ